MERYTGICNTNNPLERKSKQKQLYTVVAKSDIRRANLNIFEWYFVLSDSIKPSKYEVVQSEQ